MVLTEIFERRVGSLRFMWPPTTEVWNVLVYCSSTKWKMVNAEQILTPRIEVVILLYTMLFSADTWM